MKILTAAALFACLCAAPAIAQSKPEPAPATSPSSPRITALQKALIEKDLAQITSIQQAKDNEALNEAMTYRLELATTVREVLEKNPDWRWRDADPSSNTPAGFYKEKPEAKQAPAPAPPAVPHPKVDSKAAAQPSPKK